MKDRVQLRPQNSKYNKNTEILQTKQKKSKQAIKKPTNLQARIRTGSIQPSRAYWIRDDFLDPTV